MGAQCHDHTVHLAEIPAKRFFSDGKFNCEAGAQVAGYYNLDSIAAGFDAYNIEIEALGGKMVYGENSMPTIDFRDPLVKGPEDLARLRKKHVDWHNDGRFPFVLQMDEENLNYGMGTSMFCSPFSMACGMRSYPKLIRDMRKDPKFAHELFEFIVDDVLIPWVTVQKEVTGNINAIGADAWACIPNLSIEEMNQWVVPYNKRLADMAIKKGVLVMNVSGDYNEERMERYSKDILHKSFDVLIASQGGIPSIFMAMGRTQDYPLQDVKEYTDKLKSQGKAPMVTMGVNARLVRDGPVEQIVDFVKRVIDTFARDTTLSMFIGNIPADAPSDHIHAAVAAAHTYGKYPIANDLDTIEFEMPHRESFKEWQAEHGLTLE